MAYTKMKGFPKDFLWGASTSSYQVEGGADEGGKGKTVMDVKEPNPGRCDFSQASGHYYKYKEDIALMAEMGFKAYRMSISWARILPNGDDQEVNQAGLDFYKDIFNECHKYNIEPVVTIFHFDFPLSLVEKYGGWSNRKMIDIFTNYARILFDFFKNDVKYWLTYNEQNMMIFFGAFDMTGEGDVKIKSEKDLYNQAHIQLLAQAKVINLCHEMCPNAKIGPAPNITCTYPADANPENVVAAMNYSEVRNYFYLDALIKGEYPKGALAYLAEKGGVPDIQPGDMELLKSCSPDFIAFNFYGGDTVEYLPFESELKTEDLAGMRTDDVSFLAKLMEKPGLGRSVKNDFIPLNDYGMGVDATGIRITCRQLTDRYHLPLIITENGYGTTDELTEDGKIHDPYRIDYLKRHIEQLEIAIHEGVDLMGYCPWSAIDLISTREGCSKRYGLIYVDRDEFDVKEMKRYRKDSFYWYKKVIASNGQDTSYDGKVDYTMS